MAQVAIREYDGKKMLADFLGRDVLSCLIQNEDDFTRFTTLQKRHPEYRRWVIKPDQLFGKRGKYGLVGVNLTSDEVYTWWKTHFNTKMKIGKFEGTLETFIVEPFIPHTDEYYIAFSSERDGDILHFSRTGGIDIEENWDSVSHAITPALRGNSALDDSILDGFFQSNENELRVFLKKLYTFFVTYGFSYLELNPFIL
jgi:succinyl-CoA synthetase beta subunit